MDKTSQVSLVNNLFGIDMYKKGLVVFIDILGTKDSNFTDLYNINKIFHKELQRIKKEEIFCKKFVSSFSDCAYIIYEIHEDNENKEDDTAFRLYIHESLTDLALTLSAIQINGFMCRGGISYNDLFYEEKSNIIFGPAINEANKLETEAVMPRVIVNDELANRLYKHEKKVIEDEFRKLIRKDEFDDRYYLNFLYVFSQFDYMDYDEGFFNDKIQLGDKEYTFDEYYNILEKLSLDTIKNKTDHNIIAKHKWQLNYLRNHFKERGLKSKQ